MVVRAKNFWLVKSEPDVFSIDELARLGSSLWDGVRNYQARNFLRAMEVGDGVLFYHSSTAIPGVVGVAEVTECALPDPTQFDSTSPYYDARATRDQPRWWSPRLAYLGHFSSLITRDMLLTRPELAEMRVLAKGSRLSVTPVIEREWNEIVRLWGPFEQRRYTNKNSS